MSASMASGSPAPGTLVVVTETFPFNRVTEFVDVELPFLRDRFPAVVVAPLHRAAADPPRAVPSGVTLDLGLSRQVRRAHPSAWRYVGLPELRAGRWGMVDSARWMMRHVRAASIHRAVSDWCAARQRPAMAYTYWLGPATAAIAHAWPGTTVVSRAHGFDVYGSRHRPPAIPFQGAAISGADLVMTASDAGREHLRAQFPEATIVTRRLGIPDLGGICPGSTDDVLRAVSVSSLDPNKRVTLIAEALVTIARSGRSVDWLHLGDGPELGPIKTILERAAGLPITATFPGWIPHSEVTETLRRGPFDVMVLLSASEGAPVSLMEAQCVGIPCVATDVGGVGEVLTATCDVLLPVEFTDLHVADAILAAADSDSGLRSRRRSRWAGRYDANRQYRDLADELASLAAGASGDS